MAHRLTTPGGVFAERSGRLKTMLARVRAAQLDLARVGRTIESARLAARADLIRAALDSAAARRVGPRGAGPRGMVALAASLVLAPAAVLAQPAAVVRTAEITEDLVQQHRRVTGSLWAVSRSAVAAQEPGLVESVLVDEGTRVGTGEVIATLDARRLRAQLDEARAEHANHKAVVAQRVAELRFAELDLDRVRAAHGQAAANERELSEAETLVGVRQSQLEAARRVAEQAARRVELLEIRLEDMTVRAPFDARVVSRHVEPGEWLEPGRPVVTLVSTGSIEARLEVPERYTSSMLQDVPRLYVELEADGRTVPSVDVRPVPDVDPRARTFQVFVTLDNASGDLAPGMSVSAWVPTSDETFALLTPKDAVIRNGRDAYVYRVGDGAAPEAERTSVKVLFAWGDRLAIAADELHAGDRVVIEGNERLMPGAPVTLAKLPAARGN